MEPSQPSPVYCVHPPSAEQIDPTTSFENAVKAMESSMGELQLEFVAYVSEISERERKERLQKIRELANEIKQYSEQTADDTGKLGNAFRTIAEKVGIFCDRIWSLTTAAAQEYVRDSLASSSRREYDVYLIHSDKQKNFVRQLYRDLTNKHVSCFFDEMMPLGQKFTCVLSKAAETYNIFIFVISKDFICSKRPMIELAAFNRAMKSQKNANLFLLPIFFEIRPSKLTDCSEWQQWEGSDVIRAECEDALEEVRSTNGLLFAENGDEVAFRDKVVERVCSLIIIKHPMLLEFEPVGIEKQAREVKDLLDMEGDQSALAVILCGLRGIGKSTVAASVVQSLDWSFMSSRDIKFCRVAIDDEKTGDKTSHIIKLQKNILYDLGEGEPDLRHPNEGRYMIKAALLRKKCFLFVDNVVDKDYYQQLLPKDLLSVKQQTKLRILITSSNRNVKAELGNMCEEYEVKGLLPEDSESLLSKSILKDQAVKDDFDEQQMIKDVAAACKGVPFLLSSFAKRLRNERTKESYEEVLDVLREGNLDSYRGEYLGTHLMSEYDKIKDEELKEAFLDICAYFNGWKWDLVAKIVTYHSLQELRMRMLVSEDDSKVIVHDILLGMGLKKARFTRFLNCEDLLDAFDDNCQVKGISLVNDNDFITIQSTQLEAIRQSVRVLMLGDGVTLDGPLSHKAFRELRYLRMGDNTAFPFKDRLRLDELRYFRTGLGRAQLYRM